MRDFLAWRVAPLVSSFCLFTAAAKPAAAQAPAAPAAAPQPAPQLAAPPPAPPGAAPAAAPAPAYPGGYPPPPPGYGYPPPAYGYQPPMRSPDSVPYDGGPVPGGYHVEERPRRGLVIAGTIVLAVPYGLGLAVAGGQNFPNSTGWLIVPGIGPWLTLASRHKSGDCSSTSTTSSSFNDCVDSSLDDTTRTFLIIDGLMQTGGAVMLIAGIASPKKVIARDFVGSLHFVPSTIGRTGYGGFLTGVF